MCARPARWRGCSARCATSGKTILVVTHQPVVLESRWPTSPCCSPPELLAAREARLAGVSQVSYSDGSPSRCTQRGSRGQADGSRMTRHGGGAPHLGKGSASGVAVQRCRQLHAVFRLAGGGHLQLQLRSHGRGVAPHRRRPGVGGVSVCRRGRAQPDLGARAAQPGAGRLSRLARARRLAIPGQGGRKFHSRQRA